MIAARPAVICENIVAMRTRQPVYGAALAALVALTAVSCTREDSAGVIGPLDPYQETAAALEGIVRNELADKGLPAVSIALIDDQQIVWARGFGFEDSTGKKAATADTVYRAGSVSKLFTGVALMRLVEAGRLELDAPVTAYLPGFEPKNPFGEPITLRHLLSHRSGLVREPPAGHYFDDSSPTLEATVASLNDTTLVYRPGSRVKYSNAAVAVLGRVLETATGKPFEAAIQELVLGPLRLESTAFHLTPDLEPHLAQALMWTYDGRSFPAPTFALGMSPAGNLYSTVGDLGRLVSLLFAEGGAPGGPVLQPATLAEMLRPQFDSTSQSGFGLAFSLAELEGRRRVGHGGAIYGFATELAALPEEKIGVVVAASLDGANAVVSRIASHALRLALAAKGKLPAPDPWSRTAPIDAALARQLAGRYAGAARAVRFSGQNRGLYLWDRDLRLRVRALDERLVVDSRLAWGPEIVRAGNATLTIGPDQFTRTRDPEPRPAPAAWLPLIGEYGWDYNTLYILEDEGQLHALIEWFFRYPLTQKSPDIFAFPDRGLYHGERLVFERGPGGQITGVIAAGIRFARRNTGPAQGVTFRIEPQRPIEELRAEAAGAAPPEEPGDFRPAELLELTSLDPSLRLDIRYATDNNFLGLPVYQQARAFLQEPAAHALVRAHRRLATYGYGLLIHDAYRPWSVTKIFWDATPESMKEFVADPSRGSRHNRGCAVDLTLFHRRTGQPIEMPSGYDEFTERAFPHYPGATARQRWHRELLRTVMEAEGFEVFENEWWHFDYQDWRHYAIGNQSFEQLATAAP
jgi:CubicO group peptidase (beta-lactamase class C family)/D-alanyl-D-alanine dipeptidase